MLFGQFIDELASRLKLTIDDKTVRLTVGKKVNLSYKEIANSSDWADLNVTSEVRTIPNYVDGTISTVQNSRFVTGFNTVWTSAMEGRFFQPSNSTNWYKIIKVNSATSLTLLSPIIETSFTGTYKIWKRFYYLNSDVRRITLFGSWIQDGELEGKSQRWIQDHTTNISDPKVPENYSLYGTDPFESIYSTGNAGVTQNSDIMTGVGTAWLDNVGPGDRVEIGTQVLRVKRVESDTSIRLLNFAASTLPSPNQAYTIKKDTPKGVQFYGTPDSAYIFPYSYQKRVFDMVNETRDRPELSEDFDLAILDLAEASRMADLKDDAAQTKLQIAMGRIRDLKVTQMGDSPRYRQMIPFIRTRRGY